jgi:deazaflavin-dependent oxidoreductase (nitroreductase family)
MRVSGGRFGKVGPMGALLLTTTGWKSGEQRDVALNYMAADDSYIVVASNVGEDRDPAWWRNLKANPDAEIRVGGKRVRVRAREADGAERERLWTRIVEKDPAYDEYPAANEAASCGCRARASLGLPLRRRHASAATPITATS